MPFHTDKQRKAFFAKQGNPKSAVNPSIFGRISNIKEKLRLRRERLGKERIEKEKKLLEQERQQAERLSEESKVEAQREAIAQERIKAQQKIKVIERERFQRKIAPLKSGIQKATAGFKKAVEAERKIEKALKKK